MFNLFPALLQPGAPSPRIRLLNQHGQAIYLERLLDEASSVWVAFLGPIHSPSTQHWLGAVAQAYPGIQAAGCALLALSPADWYDTHMIAYDARLPFSVLHDPFTRFAKRFGATRIKGYRNAPSLFKICLNTSGQPVIDMAQLGLPADVSVLMQACSHAQRYGKSTPEPSQPSTLRC